MTSAQTNQELSRAGDRDARELPPVPARLALSEPTTEFAGGEWMSSSGPRVGWTLSESGECLAACVAHELRSPLATQRALLELALADGSADVSMWRAIGQDVLAACGQQERLLEACLTLARSQGGLERCERVDLALVAARALEAHDLSGFERGVALGSAWTMGDPDLLERLAVNLVSNAIRHNIVGGRIEVATCAASSRVHLVVANSGPLVPTAELERLFQPFARLDSHARSAGDGVGLGLAIVDAIANAHDATVTARARTGGGLEIHVAFSAIVGRGAVRGAAISSGGPPEADHPEAPLSYPGALR